MATAPTYCTHRQLKDIFPQVDSFDTKKALYGWTSLGNNKYVAYNTGLITQLYVGGQEVNAAQSTAAGASWSGTVDGIHEDEPTDSTVFNTILYNDSFSVGGETNISPGSYFAISGSPTEVAYIQSVDTSTNKITCLRGALGTTPRTPTDNNVIIEYLDVTEANCWYYDSYLDHCLLYSTSDPNDLLVEAGEDFSTLITRKTGNASRYLDSRLDPNLPQNQFKDKEGNYDYLIVRTTALITASFMIRSHDATSEIAANYMEEVDKNIELLNTGKASLSWQTTGDSSKGVIRDVTYTSGSVRPVDLRGRASGVDYDLIKVSISASTAGVIGTAKYNVYVKDSSGLKQNQVVTEEVITGDYQTLAHGLEIRFSGSTDASVATASNEWEVEVTGYYEEIDNANVRSIKATRGGPGSYGKYNRKSY